MSTRAGEMLELSTDRSSARIGTVGATLRGFAVDERQVAWCDPDDAVVRGSKGQVLAPWPNRLEDGAYQFADVSAHAPIDELSTHCAIHGLVRWLDWSVDAADHQSVRLRCPLGPQPAYPFLLELTVEYRLDSSGLEVITDARNVDDRAVPFAIGFHPYLVADGETIDSGALSLPAQTRLSLDARGLPEADLASRPLDWQPGSRVDLADRMLDDCFSDLELDGGRWRASFWPHSTAERVVTVWGEAAFRYLMCYTGDTLAAAERRGGIALEPMTSPPNALKSGQSLIVLAPGQSFRAAWGIMA